MPAAVVPGTLPPGPQPLCLLIADISGYLTGVELDLAQDILADLMDAVVRTLQPGFPLAKLEGEAASTYLPAERLDGVGDAFDQRDPRGIGDVPCWVLDLERRRREEDGRARFFVRPEEAIASIEIPVRVPPQVAWEYLTEPGADTRDPSSGPR
jgi:hypothetical protein